jgi:hypothetical protein
MMVTWDMDLATIEYSPDLDMRRAMLANAHSIIGLESGDEVTLPILRELLGPTPHPWPLHLPYGRGGISTCAMVALGLLRRLGVDCQDIMDGYADDIGSGLNVAIRWAKRLTPSAWTRASSGAKPIPGDVIQVVGPMHIATCIGWEQGQDGVWQCVSVDGGQVGTAGLQAVHVRRRPWVERQGVPYLGHRRVDGWLDVDRLKYRGSVTVPIGWEVASL